MKSSSFHVLLEFLVQMPLFLVWLVGFVLALMNLGRHPKIAFAVLGALALAMIASILSILASWALPEIASDLDEITRADDFSVLIVSVHFLHALALAIAFGLLLLASFGWRREETVKPTAAPRP